MASIFGLVADGVVEDVDVFEGAGGLIIVLVGELELFDDPGFRTAPKLQAMLANAITEMRIFS